MNKVWIFIIFTIFGLFAVILRDSLPIIGIGNIYYLLGVTAILCLALALYHYILYKKGYGISGIQHRGLIGYFKIYLKYFPMSPNVGPEDASIGERRDMRAEGLFWGIFALIIIIYILFTVTDLAEWIRNLISNQLYVK